VTQQKTPLQTLLDSFAACTPEQRALLQLISVAYAPVSKHVLLNLAKKAELRAPSGRSYTGVLLAEMLERLKSAGQIQMTDRGILCQPLVAHAATLSSQADGRFEPMVRAVQAEIPMVANWGSSYYRISEHALRDVRICFYRKDPQAAFDAAERYLKQYPYEAQRYHPFTLICFNPYDDSWFRGLPHALQGAALLAHLPFARNHLIPCFAPFQLLTELAADRGASHLLVDLFCQELFWRGKTEEAQRAAVEGSSSAQLAVLGCCALRSGSFPKAVSHFRAAHAALKKETGKRKTFFDDGTGPFFILALIASGDPALLDEAAEHCRFVCAKREWPDQEVYHILQLAVTERRGERGSKDQLESLLQLAPSSPTHAFFRLMALYWCGSEQCGGEASKVKGLVQQLRGAGQLFLADELDLTAGACGGEGDTYPEALRRCQEQGLAPLYRCVEPVESWQSALTALMRLTSADSAPAGYSPWFSHANRKTRNVKLIFGHWAALEGQCDEPNVFALDTGCVWGNAMTLMNLDSGEMHRCECEHGKNA